MSQQQMQFGGPEPEYEHDPDPRFINTDPREQAHSQQQSPYGEYHGYTGTVYYGEKLQPRRSPRRHKQHNAWWLFLVIPAALLLLTMGPYALFSLSSRVEPVPWHGMGPHSSFSQGYTLSPNVKTLIIHDDVGNVRIHTGDSNQGSITIHADGNATNDFGRKDQGALVDIEPASKNADATTTTATVNIRSDASFPDATSVNLDVVVPQGQTVDVQVSDSNNDVTVQGIAGNVQVSGGNGEITASNITGSVQVQSTDGSINADHINGQVNLASANGSITLGASQISGQSTLRSTDGSITFEGSIDQHGTYLLESDNGSITATLPRNTSAHFDLHANNGSSISNDFHTTDIGSNPHPTVTMSSGSGSITINAGS